MLWHLAVKVLDRAARLGLSTRAYHLRRARYLTQRGDGTGAGRELALAEAIRPLTATDYFLLGTDGQTWNRPSLAIGDFEAALRLQPDHFWALYGLAACSLRLQRWDAAKA